MSNEDKMLQLVLSDESLFKFYDYNPDDFLTIEDALKDENPVVVTVAKIIRGLSRNSDKGVQKEIYIEVFNYLNNNLL